VRPDLTESQNERAFLLNPFKTERYDEGMKQPLIFTAAFVTLTLLSMSCPAQESPEGDISQMSREQWRAHIKNSRERSEIIRRERRYLIPQPPTPEELAEEASRRILEDDSLRPGDVVSTNKGLFRYQGPLDRERRPDDFLRIR
jgi:hypothetical protein